MYFIKIHKGNTQYISYYDYRNTSGEKSIYTRN